MSLNSIIEYKGYSAELTLDVEDDIIVGRVINTADTISFHGKTVEEATTIMMNIHNKGKELCGTYTYEIATTKVAQVKSMAREKGFPLKAIMEEE